MRDDELSAESGTAPMRRERTPTWVKVAGAIAIAVIVGVIVLLMVGGDHGPGRHAPDARDHQASMVS